MIESDKGEEQARPPAQQAQQPQPASRPQNETPAPGMLAASGNPGSAPKPATKSDDVEANKDAAGANPVLDEARFTAGVVKLYEALLKEPIPEEMLRLVDQLGKQERK